MKWYHSYPELNIVGTHPYPTQEWITKLLPKSFKGKTVLDLAAWDGYYSFYTAKHGAKSVLAIDNCEGENKDFNGDASTLYRKYAYLRRRISPKVDFVPMDVLNIDRLSMTFDVILCLGLYYHVKHPYLLFEKCYNRCNETIYIEGIAGKGNRELMYFLDKCECNNDPTNYWIPNIVCLYKMLNRIGFTVVEEYKITIERLPRVFITCKKD